MRTIITQEDGAEFCAWIEDDPDGIIGRGPSPYQAAYNLVDRLNQANRSSFEVHNFEIKPWEETELAA